MPTLYILAGPNGTGKTTYYNTAIEEGFIDPALPFINVDNICRDELGGYSGGNSNKAEMIARERIKNHTENQESFMIESNLALQADYDWIDLMTKAGYNVNLYFLCTSNVDINIERVLKRVKEGGHDIPVPIIKQRFNNGLMYLKGKLHCFNEVTLIDNSEDVPRKIAVIKNGTLEYKDITYPEWAQKLLYIIERMAEKGIP